jgi:hypothetical protein
MDLQSSRPGKPGFSAHLSALLGSHTRRSHHSHRAQARTEDAGHGEATAPAAETTATSQPRLRSVARLPTTRAERYAKQLCSHAARMTSNAQWTPPQGFIEFPGDMGTCRITSDRDHLALAIEAPDPASLSRLQQIIGSDIERFASRDGLAVEWVEDPRADL